MKYVLGDIVKILKYIVSEFINLFNAFVSHNKIRLVSFSLLIIAHISLYDKKKINAFFELTKTYFSD